MDERLAKRVPIDDINVSEHDKSGKDYLEAIIDYYISSLVHEKPHIKKGRDLYDGKRDMDEFKFLEDTYGVAPMGLKMTPIARPRINALIGTAMDEQLRFIVSCTDSETVDLIKQEKRDKYVADVTALFKREADAFHDILESGEQVTKEQKEKPISYIEKVEQQKLTNKFGTSFKSDFELAAYHLVNYFISSSNMGFESKKEQLAEDLVLHGECYYRMHPELLGDDPTFEVIKPENMFMNINTNDKNMEGCEACVRREFMTKKQILNAFGQYMSKEDKEDLLGGSADVLAGKRWDTSIVDARDLEDIEDTLNRQFTYTDTGICEVFHVEWLAYNEVVLTDEEKESLQTTDAKVENKKYRQDRYEGIRIGDMYINCGKSKYQQRSATNPWKTRLTYRGVVHKGRNGKAQGLALNLKEIQDMYDLIIFYRDNLIATSGIDSSRINISAIPTVLGTTFDEQLMTFLRLRKTSGIELVDPGQKGAQDFNHYGVSKNSVDANLVISIDTILQTIEKQADIIAGTNQQMLAQIEQRDAVSNVKAGMQQSMLINKSLFLSFHTLIKGVYNDFIDNAKVSYHKGKKGNYIIGADNFLFSLDPDKFTMSDYNIHLIDNSREQAKLEQIRQTIVELASTGAVPPNVLVKVLTTDSLTDIKILMDQAMDKSDQAGQEIQQLQQQLQQAQQQSQELQKQLQTAQKEAEAANKSTDTFKAQELELKKSEVMNKIATMQRELDIREVKDREELALKRETVELEREQLYMSGDSGGNSKEVRNDII